MRIQQPLRILAKKNPKAPWLQAIHFPEHLPVSQRRDEIAHAIKNHQVLVLAGETGSGKTTQIPKICLSLGYGTKGLIAHTQPRRIAARTVAARIAAELQTELGDAVGYQVRFKDVASEQTRIKLMTDGVLLAELQRDKLLRRYEVIIIDEAHERSLNIDFLLGLLKPLCRKRPELKVIITSATIDLEKFAQHFGHTGSPAPIIEVSGRTYPVETIYQPAEDGVPLPQTISNTVTQIIRDEAKGKFKTSGDILIFCAGERDIRDAAEAIRRARIDVEILPLYSRLSITEQNRIFASAQRRKVVLATNVAETSITVPGIAYVIDPGLARISRYSFRSKVQRLPIEPVSQASANQRMGRCGRVANGVCIRLYSEDDFESRAEFTPAEILRSNLASVVLKMLKLGIRKVDEFEFLDRPDKRLLNDGFKLLLDIQAIDKNKRLTKIGHQISELSIDPKFARILAAANQENCLRDALVVVSAMSIRDPRERPAEHQQAADRTHATLAHGRSDFFSYLYLWQAIKNAKQELSNTKFKKHCTEQFWSIARIFEWRELYRQLAHQCRELGWHTEPWIDITLPIEGAKREKPKPLRHDARYQALHQSLISGLFSNVAYKNLEGDYLGTRGGSLALFPSSPLAKSRPKWLLAGELMETSKVFMLHNAEIKPEWVLGAAKHLIKYSYSAPRYSPKTGAVRANRKTLFFGLTLRDKETVNYAPINPTEARLVFIREALIEGMYQPPTKASIIHQNQTAIAEVEKLEVKTRRQNLLVSDQRLFEFYDQRLPDTINSNRSLEKWLRVDSNAESVRLDKSLLLSDEFDSETLAQFPDSIIVQEKHIALRYTFDPGQDRDGVTMLIPISVLAPFPEHIGDWLVPGLRREKCIALIKTLPKAVRRNFAPAADAVDRVLDQLIPTNRPLHEALATQLFKSRGVKVAADQFDLQKLDNYYRMNYRIVDVDGSLVEESRNLKALKQSYAGAVTKSVHADHAPERVKHERHNLSEWDFGELLPSVEFVHQGMTVVAYPGLHLKDDKSISLELSESSDEASYQTHRALPWLALYAIGQSKGHKTLNYLRKELFHYIDSKPSGLAALSTQLKQAKCSDRSEWRDKIIVAALGHACFADDLASVRDQSRFNAALIKGFPNWVSMAQQLEAALDTALHSRDQLFAEVQGIAAVHLHQDQSLEDIKSQLYSMFEPDFLLYTSLTELKQYPRYLRAIESRLQRIISGSAHSAAEQALLRMQADFDQLLESQKAALAKLFINQPGLHHFAKLLQEWRVSIFAQQLRTQLPVSEKRLRTAYAQLLRP